MDTCGSQKSIVKNRMKYIRATEEISYKGEKE
jgi:hypothetical protein